MCLKKINKNRLVSIYNKLNYFSLSIFNLSIVAIVTRQQEKTIHMILIGRASSGRHNNKINTISLFSLRTGKSSLGNTILGEKQFDLCVSSHSTIGDKCKVGFRYFHQQHAKLIVIDTPGFFRNENDIKQSIQVAFANGAYAILLTLSLEFGLTNQEEKILDMLTNIYGNKIYQYIIIVFTGLDRIDGDIQTFINEQCSSSLKQFLQRCGNRYIAIDNNANINEKNEFVSNLIELIMQISPMICRNGAGQLTFGEVEQQ